MSATDKLYKGYVETKDKKCIEKFKGRTDFKTLDEVEELPEYAGILDTNTMFIDIDNAEQSEKMLNIVDAFQLNCRVIDTTRGKHFIFKNTQVRNCKTGCQLACGLTADIKVGFVASYEVLKVNNQNRFVEYDIEDDEQYQEVPKWFWPIRSKQEFLTMKAGDGRNQKLFNYILTLQANGFTVEEIRQTIRIINRFVLADPLPDDELETILRDDAFKKPAFFNGAQFMFDKFATFIMNQKHIIKVDGNLHIYQDGIYSHNMNTISNAMREYVPNMRKNQKAEVFDFLKDEAPEIPLSDARYIAFRNGVLDVFTGIMQPHTPDFVILNKIPWDYVPGAYDEKAESVLNRLSCSDAEIRALLEECIGYCFFRSNEMQKAFILVGDKANGKSTFLDVIKKIIGTDNYSALDLKNIGDRFSKAVLYGKLANIGDDISDEFISDASLFKKITAGNTIQAEYKGQDPFEFSPYAKLIFSANNMPRIRDKTGAVLRRLVIIPFNAQFKETDKDYDPQIKQKLFEESSIEYFIALGVKGLQRVLSNHKFTFAKRVEEQIEDYRELNNPVLGFIRDNEETFGSGFYFRQPVSEVYSMYKLYCSDNGLQAEGNRQFGKSMAALLDVETRLRKIKGKVIRFYVKNHDDAGNKE